QLRLRDTSVLGPVDGPWGHGLSYDALADPELSLSFLDLATDMAQSASRVRRIGLEKSNSCLVYDDRLIIKIFRRLHAGRNPEAVLAITLDEVGFNHVATPISVWRKDPFDLALVREFLPGGTDGWALALTSLRDLFSRGGAPELAGGDFGAEARRLGEMTSKLHLALAQAFGSDPARGGEWVHGVQESLTRVSADGNARSAQVVDELGRLGIAGCSIPIHGDYHLGRVMRTEVGWYVLDLEGDPSRPLDERHERLSPLKDVAAMLRSFEYATVAAVRERGPAESAELAELPAAWERRNRAAFLDGYLGLTDIYRLVPADTATFELVLEAFELEKAARELAFELAYRPWRAPALRAALDRLLAEQQPS
ncbi:MAG: maltokinase N-terminal cap-like domain-containing protein, partial [Acidimicrobiales bacterium]